MKAFQDPIIPHFFQHGDESTVRPLNNRSYCIVHGLSDGPDNTIVMLIINIYLANICFILSERTDDKRDVLRIMIFSEEWQYTRISTKIKLTYSLI